VNRVIPGRYTDSDAWGFLMRISVVLMTSPAFSDIHRQLEVGTLRKLCLTRSLYKSWSESMAHVGTSMNLSHMKTSLGQGGDYASDCFQVAGA
jgi:hypothetical protein